MTSSISSTSTSVSTSSLTKQMKDLSLKDKKPTYPAEDIKKIKTGNFQIFLHRESLVKNKPYTLHNAQINNNKARTKDTCLFLASKDDKKSLLDSPVVKNTSTLLKFKSKSIFRPFFREFRFSLEGENYRGIALRSATQPKVAFWQKPYSTLTDLGSKSEKEKQELFSQLVFSLLDLHSNNVVYGNLKPESLIVCENGILFYDFTYAQNNVSGWPKMDARTLDTWWNPPEISKRNDESYTPAKAEMHSLGNILYYMGENSPPTDYGEPEIEKSSLNPQAKSLLSKLWYPRQGKRPDIYQTLAHPFFDSTIVNENADYKLTFARTSLVEEQEHTLHHATFFDKKSNTSRQCLFFNTGKTQPSETCVNTFKFLKLLADEKINHVPTLLNTNTYNFSHEKKIYDGFLIEVSASYTSLDQVRAKFQDEKSIIPIVRQITETLSSLHPLNIGYKCLRPATILVSDRGELLFYDFGYSTQFKSGEKIEDSDISAKENIATGNSSFKPWRLAPEMDINPSSFNSQLTDIFNIGTVVYSLRKEKAFNLIGKSVEEVIDSLSLTPDAKDFLAGLWKLKPEDRLTLEGIKQHPWIKKVSAKKARKKGK